MKKFLFLPVIIILFITNSHAQNVGIGTTTPDASALLHINLGISTTKGLLVTGTEDNSSTVPDLGSGSRMMFYPGKAAFRAGWVNGAQWDNINVGLYSTAHGYNTIANGVVSTALGNNTTASGNSATAIGINAIASGFNSISIGSTTTAAGINTTAFGLNTIARGSVSTTMGRNTISKGYASTVMGNFNDSLLTTDETSISTISPLFIVGNGDANNTRSNAMVIQKNGNVGIGNSLPDANSILHVNAGASTKALLISGTYNSSAIIPDIVGAVSRMTFYPCRAALRAGFINGTQWDDARMGLVSVAFGQNTTASGFATVAMGYNTIAIGSTAVALGDNTTANGENSTAMGQFSTARGWWSTAMGYNTYSGGWHSAAMGRDTKAKGYACTVVGMFNDSLITVDQTVPTTTTPMFIVGNGDDNIIRSNALLVRKDGKVFIDPSFKNAGNISDNALLFGESFSGEGISSKRTLSGNQYGLDFYTQNNPRLSITNAGSVGIGTTLPIQTLDVNGRINITNGVIQRGGATIFGTSDLGLYSRIAGNFIRIVTNAAPIRFYSDDDIGNNPNMTIESNGFVGIGTATPSQRLHVIGNICATGTIASCSDIRYKTNFLPVTDALPSVMKMNGIYYNWDTKKFADKGFTNARQLGFSAQEIEKLYPEIVQTDAQGFKAIDYSRLTPVLVEAIKDQQKQISSLSARVDKLSEENQQLRTLTTEVAELKRMIAGFLGKQ